MIQRTTVLAIAILVASQAGSVHAEILVSALGQNGWNSTDTRVAGVKARSAADRVGWEEG